MARWQRPARIGIGALGIAFAILVYSTIGERQTATSNERPSRLDPRAILESAGAAFQQFEDARKNYTIEADRQLTYEDGSTTMIRPAITIRNRGGRDFVISGQEARSRRDNTAMEISGSVSLTTSDGFDLTADRATFDEAESLLRVPGAVSFAKGSMSGSGAGMSYNQAADVLSLEQEVRVAVSDAGPAGAGEGAIEFSSDAGTLSRREQYLSLAGNVRALRGSEVLQGDRGVARLTASADRVTFIELRGNARVAGGGAIDAMSARDIDLDYAEDGATLERVVLRGDGAVMLPAGGGGTGRRFAGEALEVSFAPGAVVTRVIGRGNVRVDLGAAEGAVARSISAEAFEATGEPGKGLTSAYFSEGVEYRESAPGSTGTRSAQSDTLRIALAGDALTAAVFTGRVAFASGGLQASGSQATYDPARGALQLSGAGPGAGPRVGDAQIQIEADSIDVVLDGPLMAAKGNVRTTLQPRGAADAAGGQQGRMPGLLQQGLAVNVNAAALDYRGGAGGRAEYAGSAMLWQGETAVRAETLVLDRARGDLIASGNARSTIALDTGASVGRAEEIRYEDAARRMSYVSPPPPAVPRGGASGAAAPGRGGTAGRGAAAAAQAAGPQGAAGEAAPPAPAAPSPNPSRPADDAAAPPAARGQGVAPSPPAPAGRGRGPAPAAPAAAQLSGPQGELRAQRIDLFLARGSARAERLEAHTNVTLRLDRRVATGDRLAYEADGERYVLTGRATVPVTIVDECRTTTGRTVTFFKSIERIIVDGNEEVRTESSRGGPCSQPAAR